ncbi:NAD(P)-binding domain-containing protein [Sphingomonas sp. UYP23]
MNETAENIGIDTFGRRPVSVRKSRIRPNRRVVAPPSCPEATPCRRPLGPQKHPRAIILMVKAGDAVYGVIDALSPLLDPGDILIDAGNSLFSDTDRSVGVAAAKGLRGQVRGATPPKMICALIALPRHLLENKGGEQI